MYGIGKYELYSGRTQENNSLSKSEGSIMKKKKVKTGNISVFSLEIQGRVK